MAGIVGVTGRADRGHPGRDAVIKNVQKAFWFPHMREDVHKFIKSCPECQQRPRGPRRQRVPLGKAVHGRAVGSVLHVDYLTVPTSEPVAGTPDRYILTVRDDVSLFTLLYPSERATAATTCNALKDWVEMFGPPSIVVCDKAAHFHNVAVRYFGRTWGIKFHYGVSYSGQGKGVVERANREVQEKLRAHLAEAEMPQEAWSHFLGHAQYAMNAMPRRRLGGHSALEVFTGRKPVPHAYKAFESRDTGDHPLTNEQVAGVVEGIIEWQQHLEKAALLHSDRQRGQHGDDDIPKFDVGDKVMYSVVHERVPSKKLEMTYMGPVTVHSVIRHGYVYKLQNDATGRVEDVHVDRIVKYHADGTGPDTVELTEQLMQRMRRRAGMVEVMDIDWDHRVEQRRSPDNTQVKVRYQGLPDKFNQWLTVTQVLAARPKLLERFLNLGSLDAAKQDAITTLRSVIYGE